jgi:hypothetical protein
VSEKRALVLLAIGTAVLSSVAGVVLALTHASGMVYGLTIGLGAAAGGGIAGVIIAHYAKIEEREKREELILSR